ncbi:MAG TPA: GNAT family N-acetyltransferase [Thermoanaerobaculia bacterium]|nr:GNAT family N-acetyltransferase [Thermoanaerobaculia bacterium]
MSQVRFREATPADTQTIVAFQLAMARETENVQLDGPTVERGVGAVFRDHNLGRYYVAETDGQVVASLLITPEWSDWRNGMVWWIQSVFVREEWRGRRVYAGLYDFIRSRVVDDPSVRGIRLYVDRGNAAAQEVYRKLGMDGDHYQVFEWMKKNDER